MHPRVWLLTVVSVGVLASCGYNPQRKDAGPESSGGADGGGGNPARDAPAELADVALGNANDGQRDQAMVTPTGGSGGGTGAGGASPGGGGALGVGGATSTAPAGGGTVARGGAPGPGGATGSGAGGSGPVASGGATTGVPATGGSGVSTGGRTASGTGGSVTGTGGSVSGTGGSTTPCHATGWQESCPSPTVNHWANWPMPTNAAPHAHAYSSLAPGIVLDTVTGLIWQASPATVTAGGCTARVTGDQAKCYCSSLSLGGWTSGWRLPSRIELVSLIDYGRTDMAIDTVMFPNTGTWTYMSSSLPAGDPNTVWQVGFLRGDVSITAVARTEPNWLVRCVHDPATPRTPPSPRYTVSSDMVTDNGTALVWEKAFRGPTGWPAVQTICDGVTTGGKSGWRLPTIAELLTLVDETKLPPGPVIDTSAFDMPTGTDIAFTSGTVTPNIANPGFPLPWRVFFLTGVTLTTDGGNHYARCVRDAP